MTLQSRLNALEAAHKADWQATVHAMSHYLADNASPAEMEAVNRRFVDHAPLDTDYAVTDALILRAPMPLLEQVKRVCGGRIWENGRPM